MQELAGAGVALVVVQPVAEPTLFDVVAAGDDVQQHTALGEPLQRRGLLRGQRRRHQPRPKGHQELQSLGLGQQRRRGEPGVLAPGAGRGQHAFVAEPVGGAGHLRQVAATRRAIVRRARCDVTRRATRRRSSGCRRWWAGTREISPAWDSSQVMPHATDSLDSGEGLGSA